MSLAVPQGARGRMHLLEQLETLWVSEEGLRSHMPAILAQEVPWGLATNFYFFANQMPARLNTL